MINFVFVLAPICLIMSIVWTSSTVLNLLIKVMWSALTLWSVILILNHTNPQVFVQPAHQTCQHPVQGVFGKYCE